MSQDDIDFVDDDAPASEPKSEGGQLRAQLKAALTEKNRLAKELEGLRTQVASSVKDKVFAQLGVPEKARALYHGEADETAIKQWVQDYGDIFGLSSDGTTVPEPQEDLQAVQQAAQLGQPPADALSLDKARQIGEDFLKQPGRRSTAEVIAALEQMKPPPLRRP